MRNRVVPLLAVLAAAAPAVPAAESLADLYERVRATVVDVRTVEREPDPDGSGVPVSAAGLGSGVLVSAGGDVLTAAHVVQTADAVVVEFVGGDIVPARVVASVPHADVAVLRLERVPDGAAVATLGDAATVAIGDPVFVVGAPRGFSHTLTAGHVSGRRTPAAEIAGLDPIEYFQTDAAINPGNSGGPMFDMDGAVIGIVSHILTSSGGSEGLGFAVTIDAARALVLERHSPWSGVTFHVLDDELARILNVPRPYRGLLVRQVARGSLGSLLALRGGERRMQLGDREILVGGDVVLEVLGVRLTSDADLVEVQRRMSALRDGDRLDVVVLRAGERLERSTIYRETALAADR